MELQKMEDLNLEANFANAYKYLLNSHFKWDLTPKQFAEITLLVEVSYFLKNSDRLFDFDYVMSKDGLYIKDIDLSRESFLKSIPNQINFITPATYDFFKYIIKTIDAAGIESLTNFAADMFYNIPNGFHVYQNQRTLYKMYNHCVEMGYATPIFIGQIIREMIEIDFQILDELCCIRYPLKKKQLYSFQGVPF